MLKKIRLLFMGLIVLAGSACVTPTHASSAHSVVLTYIQAAGPHGAKDELITIYNNGPGEVDITGWCLHNKAAVAFACFVDANAAVRFILPGYSAATIASTEYLSTRSHSPEEVSLAYTVTSQSSGSLVGSTDTVSVIDQQGEGVDTWSWASAAPTNKYWTRTKLMAGPDVFVMNGGSADWSVQAFTSLAETKVEKRVIEVPDVPDPETPVDPILPPPLSTVIISELLPNAAGADVGKEFIELHNPSADQPQSLDGLKLRIESSSVKWYALPVSISIPAGEYKIFNDTEIGFSLPNTSATLQLYQGDSALGDPITYQNPKDDQAWALYEGVWGYVVPTPGEENTSLVPFVQLAAVRPPSEPKPCASNQYRNPETGRCRLVAAAATAPTPCKVGQERNAETGRCRNIAATTEPAPCKAGQERNLETNRCRNIVKMSTVGSGVKGVQEKASAQLSWYYWVAIVGIVALILAYAVWEWRQELRSGWQWVRTTFAKK